MNLLLLSGWPPGSLSILESVVQCLGLRHQLFSPFNNTTLQLIVVLNLAVRDFARKLLNIWFGRRGRRSGCGLIVVRAPEVPELSLYPMYSVRQEVLTRLRFGVSPRYRVPVVIFDCVKY